MNSIQNYRSGNKTRLSASQNGLGLIELMVTLVIVSLLAIVAIMIFLSGRASYLTQEQVGRLQENGRYAFHLMTSEVQRAGFRQRVWEPPQTGFALTDNTVDGGGESPDVIELQYESNRDCNSTLNTETETVVRPDGTDVEIPRFFQKVVRFSVVNNQLLYRCQYGEPNGALATQVDSAVADGVENLQIQYGEDLTNDLSVNQWVDAGDWTDLSDVVSVRIALAVRTPEEFVTESDTQTFDLYGVTTTAAGDRRLRTVYSGQASLRNMTL